MSWWSYKPYVSVAKRRANAASEVAKLKKSGRTITPVKIEGRKIAHSFWGKSWCDNLEAYSDYENRLPRGRTYVRNGSVVDLQIEPGKVTSLVSGSELYDVRLDIKQLPPNAWTKIKRRCAGQIGSVIELLQGKLSTNVMQIITERPGGMFPALKEINLKCSCPDWAHMCKHVAATLYAVGARLDHEPELLFTLRKVDHMELADHAGDVDAITATSDQHKTIAPDDVAAVFGIELDPTAHAAPTPPIADAPAPKPRRRAAAAKPKKRKVVKKTVKKKTATRGKGKKKTVRKKVARKK